jgi:CubicO group peptidase (beta-lactamase class C family)
MASVSKQFTALAVLLLEKDGKVRLDESVRKHIPELPSYADEITLRHLLHHTSGLRDYLTLGVLAGYPPDHVWTERAFLRMLAGQRSLNYPVGSEHLYSNSGYVLLSMVVHRVAGRTLDEWAREHVFAPLAMSSTRFQHDHSRLIPNRAVGYVRQDTTWRLGISMLDVVGDGGLYSTLDDMLRWAANFDNGKVAPNQLALMQTPGTLKNGNAISNGYGMGLVRGGYRGLETIGHGGALVGYRTAFFRLPAEKTTVVCLCNASTANPGRLVQRVADLYAGRAMTAAAGAPNAPAGGGAPPPDAPVAAELRKAAVGTFHSAELDAVYVLREDGERLIVEPGDRQAQTVIAGGPDRLRVGRTGVVMVLDRGTNGEINGFTLEAGRVRGVQFTRR